MVVSTPLQRGIARFALLASLVWLGLPLAGVHPAFNDDAACGAVVLGGFRLAQVQPGGAVATAEHCALCHLRRASSGAGPAEPIQTAWVLQWTDALTPDATPAVDAAPLDRQPARAPPALLL
jgi:hypothetical protein